MVRVMIAVMLLVWATAAPAQVQVKEAWARASVPGQSATGAFMALTADEGARLIGASSPLAGVVEIHEMVMDGNVMRMRPVPGIDLPPGRRVELKPGGYHVMLMDLKRPLQAGDRVPIELRFETRDKRLVTQPVEVEVMSRAPAAGSAAHKH
ncbi:MAG TPA: copper chaperone PCu(A)C [Burkholderiaceae bacterium]|nr:copper chaperone PCu(A)C [Burkholderiaceae bacterium]HQR70183.1 copper chaperone PCu(A)C [Burkholderiaceae bacterium]